MVRIGDRIKIVKLDRAWSVNNTPNYADSLGKVFTVSDNTYDQAIVRHNGHRLVFNSNEYEILSDEPNSTKESEMTEKATIICDNFYYYDAEVGGTGTLLEKSNGRSVNVLARGDLRHQVSFYLDGKTLSIWAPSWAIEFVTPQSAEMHVRYQNLAFNHRYFYDAWCKNNKELNDLKNTNGNLEEIVNRVFNKNFESFANQVAETVSEHIGSYDDVEVNIDYDKVAESVVDGLGEIVDQRIDELDLDTKIDELSNQVSDVEDNLVAQLKETREYLDNEVADTFNSTIDVLNQLDKIADKDDIEELTEAEVVDPVDELDVALIQHNLKTLSNDLASFCKDDETGLKPADNLARLHQKVKNQIDNLNSDVFWWRFSTVVVALTSASTWGLFYFLSR